MYTIMTLQDYFPADLTLLGLRNSYSQVGKDAFYVNSNCIIAKDKILTKGKHYIILDIPTKTDIKITEIVLLDLFFYEGEIHLISRDINTCIVSIIHFRLECLKNDCTKFVVDVSYFLDRMDARAVQDYCGCSKDKKKPIGKGETKDNDDLLEFEF